MWNICDLLMYALLVVAVVLRFTLKHDKHFEWARNVYAVDLILFYLRVLQLYLIDPHLGPKVIMICNMVWQLSHTPRVNWFVSDDSVQKYLAYGNVLFFLRDVVCTF